MPVRRHIPNLLSASRVLSVPVMAWAIATSRTSTFGALATFCLGADLLDGWLARRWQVTSRLGAVLDNVADVCGLIVVAIGLLQLHRATVIRHALIFEALAFLYVGAHVVSFWKRRKPAAFSGVLGRPAMASLAVLTATLALDMTTDWLVQSAALCACGAALEDIVRAPTS